MRIRGLVKLFLLPRSSNSNYSYSYNRARNFIAGTAIAPARKVFGEISARADLRLKGGKNSLLLITFELSDHNA